MRSKGGKIMKFTKLIAGVFAGLFLLAFVVLPLAQAAPPDPTKVSDHETEDQPGDGIKPYSATLNADKAARPLPDPTPAVSVAEQPPTNMPIIVTYDGEKIREVTPLNLSQQEEVAGQIGALNLTEPLSDTYETGVHPSALVLDGKSEDGYYTWNRVPCTSTTGFPIINNDIGSYSLWPAGLAYNGSPTLDVCAGDKYPPNMESWLVYGPFDLQDAQDASLDFYYRFDNTDPDDRLFWGAALGPMPNPNPGNIPILNFEGQTVTSGTYTSGPFPNGYNFVSFDLTDVPIAGDLTGSSQGVYIAFAFSSDGDDNRGQGPLIDSVTLRKNSGAKRVLTMEDFEAAFPTGYESWLSHDNNGVTGGNMRWGSVDCEAQSGNGAMWFARNAAQGFDPCTASSFDDLAYRDIESWLLYGPFNLKGTSEAWVDFYFKSDTDQEAPPSVNRFTDDMVYWWASTNGKDYYGTGVSGTYLQGPYGDGHNRMRFDLSKVAVDQDIVDLRGESNVWMAFVFRTEESGGPDGNFGQVLSNGVFIDDVSLVTFGQGPGDNQVYIPQITKSPPPVVGGLSFTNYTGNPVVVELVGVSRRRFTGVGPHTWADIKVGEYDWIASGTCPAGQGQVGSQISGRQKVTITANQNNAVINTENGGAFDCSG
jgi:hypothetical protein